MAQAPQQPAGVALACRPDRAGNKLLFPYTVTNHGTGEVYVMDALPGADAATRQATIDRHAAVIWLGADDFAHVLRGIPPLPEDRDILGHVIPLAARLPPGGTLQRTLEVPLPLAETSPYYPDLPVRQYELTDIQGVVLTVEFLRASAEGFRAEPAAGAADLYDVWSRDLFRQVERVSCTFPSRQLQILKRPGEFPRPD
jgi:hypothetical protein